MQKEIRAWYEYTYMVIDADPDIDIEIDSGIDIDNRDIDRDICRYANRYKHRCTDIGIRADTHTDMHIGRRYRYIYVHKHI